MTEKILDSVWLKSTDEFVVSFTKKERFNAFEEFRKLESILWSDNYFRTTVLRTAINLTGPLEIHGEIRTVSHDSCNHAGMITEFAEVHAFPDYATACAVIACLISFQEMGMRMLAHKTNQNILFARSGGRIEAFHIYHATEEPPVNWEVGVMRNISGIALPKDTRLIPFSAFITDS